MQVDYTTGAFDLERPFDGVAASPERPLNGVEDSLTTLRRTNRAKAAAKAERSLRRDQKEVAERDYWVHRRAGQLLHDDAPQAVETDGLDAYTASFDFEAQTARLPAIMERSDNETLLYAGKLNSIFGIPGAGKSWVAAIAIDCAVALGGNVIYWDFEDSPQTFKRRTMMLGFDPLQHPDAFKYLKPPLANNPTAIAEAQSWLQGAPDPVFSLVVIDSAESAGCPSDGADVAPWFESHVQPWRDADAGVLLLDHVPKQREDRPRGAIGSQHKLARIDGAALAVSGAPWTKRTGGYITLTLHKDRGGDLPVPHGKHAAVIKGTYTDGHAFGYTIEAAEEADDEDLNSTLLEALVDKGRDGVTGKRAMRGLVQGKGTAIDAAIQDLEDAGLIVKSKAGQADNFKATEAGRETVRA